MLHLTQPMIQPFLGPVAARCRRTFDSTYANTVLLTCSDGRFTAEDAEVLTVLGITAPPDRIVIPGGPGAIHERSRASLRDRCAAQDQLRFLVRHHRTRRVILISHARCGHYVKKYPDDTPEQRIERQLMDLVQVAHELATEFATLDPTTVPQLDVYFAQPEDGHVVLRTLYTPPSSL